MDDQADKPVADDAEAADVARRIVADPAAGLLEWSAAPLVDVGVIETTGGLYRVQGRVRTQGAEVPWTCVLKVLVQPPHRECLDPSSWCYWRREAAFYGSAVPTAMTEALRAPRPYMVVEGDAVAHVWMEHVSSATGPWEIAEFERAAAAAGRAAGSYLTGRPLPAAPWLAGGFLRGLLGDGGFWATTMSPANDDTWSSPLVTAFGPAGLGRVRAVWEARDALLAVADALPRVFGHGDLHPRNILLPRGEEQVVAVDWGFCGPAPLGADLADLVVGPAWFCDIDFEEVAGVEEAAGVAFARGLRSAGWDGDLRLVRLGYAVAAGLRAGACLPGWARHMLAPEQARSSELLFGRPAEAILEAWVALAEHCLDLAAEARALARAMGVP